MTHPIHPHLENSTHSDACEKIYRTCVHALTANNPHPYYTYGLASEYGALLGVYGFEKHPRTFLQKCWQLPGLFLFNLIPIPFVQKLKTKWFDKNLPSKEKRQKLKPFQENLKSHLGVDSYGKLKAKVAALMPYKAAIDAIQERIYQISKLPAEERLLSQYWIILLYALQDQLREQLGQQHPFDETAFKRSFKELNFSYARGPIQLSKRIWSRYVCWLSEYVYGIDTETSQDTLKLDQFRQLVDDLTKGNPIKDQLWPKFEINEHHVKTKDDAFVEYLVFKHADENDVASHPERPWIFMFPGASSPFASTANGLRMRDLAKHTNCNVMLLNNRAWSLKKQAIHSYKDVVTDTDSIIQNFLRKYDNHNNIMDRVTFYGHCGGGMVAQMSANHYWQVHQKPPKIVLDRNPASFQLFLRCFIRNNLDYYITPKNLKMGLKTILKIGLSPLQVMIRIITWISNLPAQPLLSPAKQKTLKNGIDTILDKIIYIPRFISFFTKWSLIVATFPLQLFFEGFLKLGSYTPWSLKLSTLYLEYPASLKRIFSISPKRDKRAWFGIKETHPELELDFLLQKRATLHDGLGHSSIKPWRHQIKHFFHVWLHHEKVKSHKALETALIQLKQYIKEAKVLKKATAKREVDPHYVVASQLKTRFNTTLTDIIQAFTELSSADLLNSSLPPKDNAISAILHSDWGHVLFKQAIDLHLFEVDAQRSKLTHTDGLISTLESVCQHDKHNTP